MIGINRDHDNPRGHLIGKKFIEAEYSHGKKILEIGGQIFPMKKYFPGVKLLDIDNRWNPDFLCDAEDMKPIADRTFDIIYSSHFFEHVYRPEKILMECHRILKKNGLLFFIVPVVRLDRLWVIL